MTRLDDRWAEMIQAMPGLGNVMTLTRNEYAVHEKVGRFEKVSVSENGGLVLGTDIDLRLSFSRWRHGYAVADERNGTVRHSLQFFDATGTAVFKIHLRENSDLAAFERLVAEHRADRQEPGERVEPPKPAAARRPDHEVDVDELRRRWEALEDVHHFVHMLRDLDVDRVQACRLVGPRFAEKVTTASFCQAVEQAAETGLAIMIFVPSPAVVQIHTGPVKNLKRVGAWFNVLDPGFNLHLRDEGIAEAWVVRKPTREGLISSLEIFGANGEQIAWMFGQRDPGTPERDEWRKVLSGLERTGGEQA